MRRNKEEKLGDDDEEDDFDDLDDEIDPDEDSD
jgi:hypothetical protein